MYMNNEDLKFYILCIVLILTFIWCCIDFTKKNKIDRVIGVCSFIICFSCFQWSFLQRVGANTIIIKVHIEENAKKEIVQVRMVSQPLLPVSARQKSAQEGWERLKNTMKQNPKVVKIELI